MTESTFTINLLITAVICLLFWSMKNFQRNKEELNAFRLTTWLAPLFASQMCIAKDVLLMFINFVALSLILYSWVIGSQTDFQHREASLKYTFSSLLTTGLIVYVVYLIYDQNHCSDLKTWIISVEQIFFILTALAFKLALFPSLFIIPEIYESAQHEVFTLLAIPSKLTFGLLLLQWWYTALAIKFSKICSICVGSSLLFGANGALQARKIKTFFAYGSAVQVAFFSLLFLITNKTTVLFSYAFAYLLVYLCNLLLFIAYYLPIRHVTYIFELRIPQNSLVEEENNNPTNTPSPLYVHYYNCIKQNHV